MNFDTSVTDMDFSHFARLTEVSMSEAVNFLAVAQLLHLNSVSAEDLKLTKSRIRTIMLQGLRTKEFKYRELNGLSSAFDQNGELFFNFEELFANVKDICHWADKKNYHIPKELKALINEGNIDLMSNVEMVDKGEGAVDCLGVERPSEGREDLMAVAEQLIESAHKTKRVSDTIHAKNASGPRQPIRYAKVQAAYRTLLAIRQGCTCTSRNLEDVVFNEICEEVLRQYPKAQESKMREYYVKQGVNLAMKTDPEATTRILNLNGRWDNKWLDIQCKIPGHKK